MTSLWFYRLLSGAGWMSYRVKIMLMAFLGTHIPLISLAAYFAFQTASSWAEALRSLGVTVVATLVGTAVTLFVLDQLLRPVIATSAALRAYRENRTPPTLPGGFTDEVGTLMANAQGAMTDLEAMLVRLEHVDEATGLPNRAGFLQGRRGKGAVAVVRVSNLAQVAEGLSRAASRGVLREVAARLARRFGPEVGLGRVGEADLAFWMDAEPDDEGLSLREALAEVGRPVPVGEVRVTPILAAGVAAVGEEAARALEDATAAIATTTEAAPVAAHSPSLRGKLRERFHLEEDLRAAIRNEEFALHFQPIMDVEAGCPMGAEALIRWRSPTRGMVPPGAFIPIAEAAGLMEPIGRWVLREACRHVAGWDEGLKVAINLAAPQFMDEDLAWHVMEAASDAGVAPSRLEIELTESVALVDHDHTRRAFGQLRDMGVGISIDDFGTGYASMSTLRKLPFDKLKIDREFVSNVQGSPGSQAICEAMIALGRGLGLRVLAEGTETAEEVAFLTARGCGLFQGFHFSRPVPAEALAGTFAALGGAEARKAS